MPNLTEILQSPTDRAAFQNYLQRDHAGGNVDFVAAAGGYSDRPTWAAAQRIFQQFVSPDAQSQANISLANRDAIRDQLKAPENFFDHAEQQALNPRIEAFLLQRDGTAPAGPAPGVSEMMANADFREFLRQQDAGALNFAGAVEAFRSDPSWGRAQNITDQYLAAGAPGRLDIGDVVVEPVVQPPLDLFGEATADATRFMSSRVEAFTGSLDYLNLHMGEDLARAGVAAGGGEDFAGVHDPRAPDAGFELGRALHDGVRPGEEGRGAEGRGPDGRRAEGQGAEGHQGPHRAGEGVVGERGGT